MSWPFHLFQYFLLRTYIRLSTYLIIFILLSSGSFFLLLLFFFQSYKCFLSVRRSVALFVYDLADTIGANLLPIFHRRIYHFGRTIGTSKHISSFLSLSLPVLTPFPFSNLFPLEFPRILNSFSQTPSLLIPNSHYLGDLTIYVWMYSVQACVLV